MREAIRSVWASSHPNLRGVICVVTGMVIFTSQDAAIKSLSGRYPLHEIVALRSVIALLITASLILFTVGLPVLRTRRLGWHVFRAALLVTMNLSYFVALAALPIAETMGLFFIAPLLLTLLSAVVLKERIGVHRLGAVLVGLAGMLLVVRPGGAIWQPVALLPLFAALCYAVMQLSTRYLGRTESPFTMAFYAQSGFFLVSASFGLLTGDGSYAGHASPSLEFLLRAWSMPEPWAWALIVFCGVTVALGALLMSAAYRSAEVAVVAPFEYAALPAGVLWGYLVFGDLPDALAFVGIGVIGASGLYVVARELRRKPARTH